MRARVSFDYSVIRVVPRVERDEFVNAGVIVFCRTRRFLAARIAWNPARISVFNSSLDGEGLEKHLALIPLICEGGAAAGPIGRLEMSERFHWLVAPRSTVIQMSPVHSGLCDDPAMALERLLSMVARVAFAEDTAPDAR